LWGHRVNRKRAQRLMRSMGLAGMAPGPNTSWAHPHSTRGVPVSLTWRAAGACQSGLEYRHHLHPLRERLCLPCGHHRLVLPTSVELAYEQHDGGDVLRGLFGRCFARAWQTRSIQQSDQGTQFTSEAFTGVLKREGIISSMDGHGAVRMTTSLSSPCGAASSMKTCTSMAMPPWVSY
jgi:putative transposase